MTEQIVEKRTGKWKQLWLVFYVIFSINMFVFSLITILMNPLWYDINSFLIAMLGVNFNWLAIILTLTFLLFGYSIFLVIFHFIKRMKIPDFKPHLANRIVPFPIIVIWNAMLYLLVSEAGNELSIVSTQLEFFSPILWILATVFLSVLLIILIPKGVKTWVIIKRNKNEKINAILVMTLLSIIFISFLLAPLVLLPSNVIAESLPPKPKIIAHRGASHLAPENTIAAGEMAVLWGADGWELDVAISYDGIFFMMHDIDLKRTTNIKDVFPERINEPVSNFTFSELRLLDAGTWFVEKDPFKTIKNGFVSLTDVESYRGEKIPSLAEVINFTKQHNLLLDIDYRRPAANHPFYSTYYEQLVQELENSNLAKNILINSNLPLAENMTHVCDALPVDEILTFGYELVNTHHGLSNRQFNEYEKASIDVMVWTVDLKSRFSQLWCLGVDYIKTNDVHIMIQLSEPLFSLIKVNYYIMISLIAIFTPTVAIVIAIIILTKTKNPS